MAQPKLLLLDEPSLGLAPIVVQQVFQIIAGIRAQGTTVLLVEQNAHMALSIGDRGYVLETGRLVAEGTPEALWNNDELLERSRGVGTPRAKPGSLKITPLTCLARARSTPKPTGVLRNKSAVCGLNRLRPTPWVPSI